MDDINNEMEVNKDQSPKRKEDWNKSAQKARIYGDTEQKTIHRH